MDVRSIRKPTGTGRWVTTRAVCAAVLALFASRADAASANSSSGRPSAELVAVRGRDRALVRLWYSALGPKDSLAAVYRSGGWDIPKTAVTALKIEVAGKRVFVPADAIIGLRDPTEQSISVLPKGFRLKICGADGANYYCAELDFDGQRVLSRRIRGSDDEPPTSETVYRMVVIG